MITFGIAKAYKYEDDGTLKVQVRIPPAHGPYKQQPTRSIYVQDKDLPWISSILLPKLPEEGDVVALLTTDDCKSSEFIVVGLTGGNYHKAQE